MTKSKGTDEQRPLIIYDGDCRFCTQWVERWLEMTGDAFDAMPSQSVAAEFPDIRDFDKSVYVILPDGSRLRGAKAVFVILSHGGWVAQLPSKLVGTVPFILPAAEVLYRMVASNRQLFSRLTTLLWGGSLHRPTYGIANALFLRMLAVVYVIAFASYLVQLPGLVGSHGVLPAGDLLAEAWRRFGPAAIWDIPSLLWLNGSDGAMTALCWIGIAAACIAIVGVAQPVCFGVAWASMLSLVSVGGDFYAFQWDALLVECGFLAVLLSPWSLRPGFCITPPPALARWLAVLLLFRLMFSSGVVKLSSGDPSWSGLTALDYHFFTQPLPNPLAWWMGNMPRDLLHGICATTLVIELLVPFAFFMPRVPRLLAFLATAGLQVAISLTGNYAFFNLLTIALCLYLVDDFVWTRRPASKSSGTYLPGKILTPVATALILLGIVPLVRSFRIDPLELRPLSVPYDVLSPLRIVNAYGLFAVMTKERREIIIQGSDDGFEWKTYEFRWKPGPPGRKLPVVAPYQPRLDWQMWFAALGTFETTPWFQSFLARLLEGQAEVTALLEKNPFPDHPPRFVRAQTDTYTFTNQRMRNQTGNWWRIEPQSIYAPELSLQSRRDR